MFIGCKRKMEFEMSNSKKSRLDVPSDSENIFITSKAIKSVLYDQFPYVAKPLFMQQCKPDIEMMDAFSNEQDFNTYDDNIELEYTIFEELDEGYYSDTE